MDDKIAKVLRLKFVRRRAKKVKTIWRVRIGQDFIKLSNKAFWHRRGDILNALEYDLQKMFGYRDYDCRDKFVISARDENGQTVEATFGPYDTTPRLIVEDLVAKGYIEIIPIDVDD